MTKVPPLLKIAPSSIIEIDFGECRSSQFITVDGYPLATPVTRVSVDLKGRDLPRVTIQTIVLPKRKGQRDISRVTLRGRLVPEQLAQEFTTWLDARRK